MIERKALADQERPFRADRKMTFEEVFECIAEGLAEYACSGEFGEEMRQELREARAFVGDHQEHIDLLLKKLLFWAAVIDAEAPYVS